MHAYTNTKSNRNMSMSDYKTLLCIPIINIHPNRILPLKNSGNRRRWTYLHKVGFFFQVGRMGYPTWIFELLNQKYNLNNTRNTLPIFYNDNDNDNENNFIVMNYIGTMTAVKLNIASRHLDIAYEYWHSILKFMTKGA